MGILIHVILNSLNLNYNPDGLTLLTKAWIVDDLTILFMIFFISIIGSLGIISLISAYRIGSPIINAPTEYILLIFALAGGFIFFEELPDFYSIIGMVLIILSGIYIVFRENRDVGLFKKPKISSIRPKLISPEFFEVRKVAPKMAKLSKQ